MLEDIKKSMISKFKKIKSESHYVMELKEIKQMAIDFVWELDQQFKVLMGKVIFNIPLEHHKEWFIVALLPHIKLPLMK